MEILKEAILSKGDPYLGGTILALCLIGVIMSLYRTVKIISKRNKRFIFFADRRPRLMRMQNALNCILIGNNLLYLCFQLNNSLAYIRIFYVFNALYIITTIFMNIIYLIKYKKINLETIFESFIFSLAILYFDLYK